MSRHVLAIATVIVLAACGGGDTPPESASEPSAQAAAPTVAPTLAATAEPTTAPTEEGPPELGLDPEAEAGAGVYRSEDPPLTLTVPPPTGDLRWFGLGDSGFLILRLGAEPCDGCEVGGVIAVSIDGDVKAATQEWQDLKPSSLSRPKPVNVGGARGVTFRGEVSPKPGVSVVHDGLNPYGSVVVYILNVGGRTVVVYEEYRPGKDAKTFLAEADKVVRSMRFTL